MADKTEKQELGSITAFYYAIERGVNLGTIKEPAVTLGSRAVSYTHLTLPTKRIV